MNFVVFIVGAILPRSWLRDLRHKDTTFFSLEEGNDKKIAEKQENI